jgi:eukaryotic-like serine/threonine-protein kinase
MAGAVAILAPAYAPRRAIELLPASSPRLPPVHEHLVEALMYAGRYEDAAHAYLAAAEVAAPDRRIDVRREAAHQLLSGGHIEKAGKVLHDVLTAVSMSAPRSTLAAVLWLMIYRLWLRIVGLRYHVLAPDAVPASRRLRIDALYTVVGGFSLVDPILGACMQAPHLIEALRGADGFRLLRAIVLEVAHAQSAGEPETPRERELLVAVRQLNERVGISEAQRYVTHVRGLTCFQGGQWAEAHSLLRSEADTLPYGHPGMTVMRLYLLFTDYYLGDLGASLKRSRKLLAQAEERGDLYTAVNLRSTSVAAA